MAKKDQHRNIYLTFRKTGFVRQIYETWPELVEECEAAGTKPQARHDLLNHVFRLKVSISIGGATKEGTK